MLGNQFHARTSRKPQFRFEPPRLRRATAATNQAETMHSPYCSPEQGLQRHAVEPTASRLAEEEEDDVIYLGTFPRQPHRTTADSTLRCSDVDSNQRLGIPPRRNTRKKNGRGASQDPRKPGDARTAQPGSQSNGVKPSRRMVISAAIRNQDIWLGWAKNYPYA